jgi:uncharacterized membrane protein
MILLVLLHIFVLILDAGLLSYFVQLPIWQREEAFFGVRVSAADYREPGRWILKRYRLHLAAAFILIEAAALTVPIYLAKTSELRIASIALPRVAALLTLSLVATILYALSSRQVRAFEVAQERRPVASSLRTRRFGDYTHTAREVVITALTVAPLVFLLCRYPMLSEQTPLGRKSFFSAFSLPLLILYAQGWFLLIKHGLVQGAITLPADHPEEYWQCKEESLRLGVGLMDWLRGLFAVPLIYIVLLFTFWSVERFYWWAAASTAFGLSWGAVALLHFNSFEHRWQALHQRLRAAAGRVYIERQTDASHWRLGKLFYYNPDNPALFVETPVGPSYTYNLANKWVYAHAAYLAGLALLIAGVLWLG